MTTSTLSVPKRIKTGGTAGKKPQSAGPIRNGETYTLDEFKARSRWGNGAIRSARRNGLRMILAGNICFIRGEDFNQYLEKVATEQIGEQV